MSVLATTTDLLVETFVEILGTFAAKLGQFTASAGVETVVELLQFEFIFTEE